MNALARRAAGLLLGALCLPLAAFAADVPEWIARRLERSYAAVAAALDVLNRASIESARKISVISAKPIRSTALWMASLHCNSL